MKTKQTWFITGASKGLGLTLAQTLLENGHRVAATSRDAAALVRAIGPRSEGFIPLEVNLSDEESVGRAVLEATRALGPIDVAVNNAGYGQFGTIEEVSDFEARKNFEVNVFGALNVIRAVLPQMRERRSGHVFNISSIGGYSADFPGIGIYCATKFALAGISEGLRADLAPFGVHVTTVYPGYFRTQFLDSGSMMMPARPIAEYQAARDSAERHAGTINGNQPGDPRKAAEVMMRVAAEAAPPLHLFLGKDAYALAQKKDQAVQNDLETWKHLTVSTDHVASN